MEVIKREKKLCFSCMEPHEVWVVRENRTGTYHQTEITYKAMYEYCEKMDEYTATEEMIRANAVALKDAYRKAKGLLTSREIEKIRKQYQISQADFSSVLGWGGKTITRYESCQIQDMAHNDILVKISEDPEWFMTLLERSRGAITKEHYQKYYEAARQFYAKKANAYIKKTISSLYAEEDISRLDQGNADLNLEKAADAINYIAFHNVPALYLVKLMRLLWYSDAYHFKKFGKSITGLAYKAFPTGVAPVGYQQLMSIQGIRYEEKEVGDGVGYLFLTDPGYVPVILDEQERHSIDIVVEQFGTKRQQEVAAAMHQEDAYQRTPAWGIISFRHAESLSISET